MPILLPPGIDRVPGFDPVIDLKLKPRFVAVSDFALSRIDSVIIKAGTILYENIFQTAFYVKGDHCDYSLEQSQFKFLLKSGMIIPLSEDKIQGSLRRLERRSRYERVLNNEIVPL